ncbi:MAG: prephenate dehydrogenase [Bacteroidetes bacterium]|nr:prephenate dehydrogenase [Bacteroidota bacterium]
MIDRISIIGTGLMGGSFGLALRRTRPELIITGFDRPEVIERAVERGAVTHTASSLEEAVRDADVVLLCVPVLECMSLVSVVAPYLKQGCVLTDVCSVKSPLAQTAASVLPDGVSFVGGHPMTGSEKAGIDHADEFLYENATYVLCPPDGEDQRSFLDRYSSLVDLVGATGARVMLMDAARHDRIAACISHVPQLLSIALVNTARQAQKKDPELLRLSAGGFRDMTRIASSSYGVWREILTSNSGPILDAIDSLMSNLQLMRDLLSENDLESMERLFKNAESTRSSIPPRSKGFLNPLADVFVFVTDRPGAIHHISGILAEADISIKDIELLKIREGTGGTFRLGLDTDEHADQALKLLSGAGIKAHRL